MQSINPLSPDVAAQSSTEIKFLQRHGLTNTGKSALRDILRKITANTNAASFEPLLGKRVVPVTCEEVPSSTLSLVNEALMILCTSIPVDSMAD